MTWPKPGELDERAPLRRETGMAAGKKRSPDRRADADRAEPDSDWVVRVVREDGAFEALYAAWSALLDEAVDANVFLSHEWLYSWWSAYRPGAELAIVVAERAGRVVGIAPLMLVNERRRGIAVRVLRFIGDGSGETDHMNFVVARAGRSANLERLLARVDALPWDLAEFSQMLAHSPNVADLQQWIRDRGRPFDERRSACPVRRLPASAPQVLATLPSRLRTSIRSARAKLARDHRLEFGLVVRADELDEALADFHRNHASRWQAKGQSGIFADPRRREFYARLTPRLHARGWLRLFHLKLDGRTVAQQYCFALDDTVLLLQEGFDFAYAQHNVGNVLRAWVFEHLAETGARCYDFLAGTSRHKASWSDAVVEDVSIVCPGRSLRGRAAYGLVRATDRLKDRLRPWRDRLRGLRTRAAAAQRENA